MLSIFPGTSWPFFYHIFFGEMSIKPMLIFKLNFLTFGYCVSVMLSLVHLSHFYFYCCSKIFLIMSNQPFIQPTISHLLCSMPVVEIYIPIRLYYNKACHLKSCLFSYFSIHLLLCIQNDFL